VTLKVDGKPIAQGKDFRVGYRHNLDNTDIIMWLRINSQKPVTFTFSKKALK